MLSPDSICIAPLGRFCSLRSRERETRMGHGLDLGPVAHAIEFPAPGEMVGCGGLGGRLVAVGVLVGIVEISASPGGEARGAVVGIALGVVRVVGIVKGGDLPLFVPHAVIGIAEPDKDVVISRVDVVPLGGAAQCVVVCGGGVAHIEIDLIG